MKYKWDTYELGVLFIHHYNMALKTGRMYYS